MLGGGRVDRIGTPDEVWADPGTVHAARCLGHENLVDLDADGRCALGRLGDRSGTVLLRSDRLALAGPGEGVAATVGSVARRAGRPVATVSVGGPSVGGLEVRVPVDEESTWRPGDAAGLVVPADAVVPLSG